MVIIYLIFFILVMLFGIEIAINLFTVVNDFFIFMIYFIIYIFDVIISWHIFEKANKPGILSLFPIYNKIVLFKIIDYKWYYILLIFLTIIPTYGQVLLLILYIYFCIKLAESFDCSIFFTIGLIILNPIFIFILAFNKNIKYVGTTVNKNV